jgi:hypothetical protein
MNTISPAICKDFEMKDPVVIRKRIVIDRNINPMPFIELLQDALDTLNGADIGKKLIQKIEEGHHNVNIISSIIHNTAKCCSSSDAYNPLFGSPSDIKIAQEFNSKVLNRKAEPIDKHFEVILGHELIHAYHNSYGLNQSNLPMADTKIWTNQEEYNTIMGNTLVDGPTPICENAIRKERGLPERFSHWGANSLSERYKSILINAAQAEQSKAGSK